jgi:hypothetical protein
MNGLIETEAFSAEIQPMGPHEFVGVESLGTHVIYDMEDLVLPNNVTYSETVRDFGGDVSFQNGTDIGSGHAYVMGLVTASDRNP